MRPLELAEAKAKVYAENESFEALDLFQGYWLFDEVNLIPQGSEIFSLLRASDLDAEPYLDAFFGTGEERQTDYEATAPETRSQAEGASPNPWPRCAFG